MDIIRNISEINLRTSCHLQGSHKGFCFTVDSMFAVSSESNRLTMVKNTIIYFSYRELTKSNFECFGENLLKVLWLLV